MNALFFVLLGYLSGSVLYAYYLPLWLRRIDVTADTEDGNPGVFNCVARAGWPMGLLALACEIAKGALPVLLARAVLDPGRWIFALVIAAPVAGHAWSLFRPGRGGKGIAVSFGVMLGLLPLWQPFALLAACYLLFSLVVQIQPHRFRSLASYFCFGAGMLIHFGLTPVGTGCALSAAIVMDRHRLGSPEEERPSVRVRRLRNTG